MVDVSEKEMCLLHTKVTPSPPKKSFQHPPKPNFGHPENGGGMFLRNVRINTLHDVKIYRINIRGLSAVKIRKHVSCCHINNFGDVFGQYCSELVLYLLYKSFCRYVFTNKNQ
jgi:hypothetical protein